MDLYMARQPIFTQRQEVYAYELLFRADETNVFPEVDPDQASARVIADSLLVVGLPKIAAGKPAFVKLTRYLLLSDVTALLPKDEVVIEIVETAPDAKLVGACERLKQKGFTLVLDNFVERQAMAPLVGLASIIKVDVLATAPRERAALVTRYARRGIALMAAKVETAAAFKEAADLGYTYFQGYFFAKPAMLHAKTGPEFRLTYLALLKEVMQADVDFRRVAGVIARDVTLSYKLLKYINSAHFGLRREITSILEALALLGERELKRWTSLIGLASVASGKPAELVREAALRARFCEGLAEEAGLGAQKEQLFLLGMFSLLDAILDRPLEVLLQELPISEGVKAALLGEPGRFRDIYECMLAYNSGNWESVPGRLKAIGVDEAVVPKRYSEAVHWAQEALSAPAAASA